MQLHLHDACRAGLAAPEAAASNRLRHRVPLAADVGTHAELILANDEGPAGGTAGLQGVAQSVSHYCPAAPTLGKALVTMKAQLALRGYALHELSGGSFLVNRWNLTKSLVDLYAVRAFLRQIGCAE